MTPKTLTQVATELAATLHGDGSRIIEGIKPLECAGPTDLSFFAPNSRRKHKALYESAQSTRAAALIVKEFDADIPVPQLVHSNPMLAVVQFSEAAFSVPRPVAGIHPTAVIDESVEIHPSVSVGPYTVIGARAQIAAHCVLHAHVVLYPCVVLGKNCEIHSGATIRENVVLGADCIVQNGVVIGADGFGYLPDPKKGHRRIPQIGTVVLENGVEIGANSTIDRATLGETRVGANSKIDNQVMLAHNVQVGQRVIICAQTGVAGSSTIGNDCVLGGRTGIADHVTLGAKVRTGASSGIRTDVPGNQDIAGDPWMEVSQWRRHHAFMGRLLDLRSEIREIRRYFKFASDKGNR